jgi:hypothetical protein
MKALARRLAATAAVIAAITVVLARTGLVATDVAFRLGALGAVAAGVILVLKDINAVAPQSPASRFAAVANRRAEPVPAGPARLRALERDIPLALADARRCHTIVRPVLRAMAAELADNTRGVDIDRDPAAAEAIFGPQVWDLIRPGRAAPPPGQRDPAPQIDLVTAALDRLEDL